MIETQQQHRKALLEGIVESALEDCRPSTVRWNYENGLILLAILTASKRHFAHRWDNRVRELADVLIGSDGTIRGYARDEYNIDQINAGKVVFELWKDTGKPAYEKALDALMGQLASHPRTPSGSFWHKKIYPDQVWLDGLYMFGPFFARYAAEFSHQELFRDLCAQLFQVRDRMRDGATGLYYHGWDESRRQRWANVETGLSPHFWGRATGWLAMALVDILDWLPPADPDRQAVAAMFRDLMASVAAVQDESGLWLQILDAPGKSGNYLEESASAMFACALFKGMRRGYLDQERFAARAEKAIEGLTARFVSADASGRLHVNGICKVAGLGGNPYRDGSYAYYIGEPIVSDDYKGVGPLILALCEALANN